MNKHVALAVVVFSFLTWNSSYSQSPYDTIKEIVFVSGKPVYIIAKPATALEKRIVDRLSVYLLKVLKKQPVLVSMLTAVPAATPAIILSSTSSAAITSSSPEAYSLETTTINKHQLIIATGKTVSGLKRSVQRLIIESQQRAPGLIIPALKLLDSPWIAQREWAICPWSPDQVRRSFSNPAADKRLNIWLYSHQQVNDYVEMFDWFGFNGCQLMETSANYAAFGSREAFRDRQLTFAKAVHENGQQVTYWVWAAQFTDYGWFDPDVAYQAKKGNTAFTDPAVRAAFEKYYDGYATMAPYVDMLIAHFYDPGSLTNREDVFNYLELLQRKFKLKNPGIRLGVDFWAVGSPQEYMKQLIDHGFGNALLLEMSLPIIYPQGKREQLHEAAKTQHVKMGMWGWYMTEYETDQMPMMHVNAKALKDFYLGIKNGVHNIQPITYWSEMEAYHLNNIFTMYAAGQLLWNPYRNTDDILKEITEGIWGPRNGAVVLDALKLIEDARSGPSWNTFWWKTPAYRLGTNDPAEDFNRAERSLELLEKMTTDSSFVPKFPLPFPPSCFVELIIPHLRQIKLFADFRIKEKLIREAGATGATKEQLTSMVTAAWKPVPEYNTWIGSFGQPEAMMQESMIERVAKDYGLQINEPGWMQFRNADRYLQRIQNVQRTYPKAFHFNTDGSGVRNGEFTWSREKATVYMTILIRNGLVEKLNEDTYQLTNWKEYKLRGQREKE